MSLSRVSYFVCAAALVCSLFRSNYNLFSLLFCGTHERSRKKSSFHRRHQASSNMSNNSSPLSEADTFTKIIYSRCSDRWSVKYENARDGKIERRMRLSRACTVDKYWTSRPVKIGILSKNYEIFFGSKIWFFSVLFSAPGRNGMKWSNPPESCKAHVSL